MEQAESNLDSLRVFTKEKWFVQLGMAARGIACCSKCGTSGRIVVQGSAFKLRQPLACSPGPSIRQRLKLFGFSARSSRPSLAGKAPPREKVRELPENHNRLC